ncbi:hypothetical protein EDC01DRAFT_683336 [Geopyxis carbonaria]|nr:hypothetical protein EDC01DRAFT_683336 [Geopyxis carbonaria]
MPVGLEGRICLEVLFAVVLFGSVALRFWALRFQQHRIWSARGVSDLAMIFVFVIWLYFFSSSVWVLSQQLRWRGSTDASLVPPLMLPPKTQASALKIFFVARYVYYLCLYAIKVAFVALFFETKRHMNPTARKLLYVTTATIAACFIFSMLITSLWCKPFASNYQAKPGEYELCSPWHFSPMVASTTAVNVLTDVMIMAISIAILKTLQLSRGEGWALGFLFFIGGITLTFSFVRLVLLVKYNAAIEDDPTGGSAFTLDDYGALFSETEVVAATLAGALPPMRVWLRRSQENRSRKGGGGSSGLGGTLNSLSNTKNGYVRDVTKDQNDNLSETELQLVGRGV